MKLRVLRSGSYLNYDSWVRLTTSRRRIEPESRNWNYGFRIVVKRVKQ